MFQSDMYEQQFLKEREARLQSGRKKCQLYTVRFIINFFIVLVLGASGYLIYYVTDYSTEVSMSYRRRHEVDISMSSG